MFKLKPEQIKDLIPHMGYCHASDRITVNGEKVGFMYREEPADEDDSGWRFLSGTEDQDYIDDPANSMIFEVNTIANYDAAIIPYLKLAAGTELEREPNSDSFTRITE
ncbi:MAG: DUF2185 domain-containing protein [Bacteroidales bacterium]